MEARQPLAFHLGIHWLKPWRTYSLSVNSSTREGRFSVSSPRMTLINSIRLFVVAGSEPDDTMSRLRGLDHQLASIVVRVAYGHARRIAADTIENFS